MAAKPREIDGLSPKQNGSAGVDSDQASAKTNKSSIKGMWRKAFKSLKTKDKEKDRDKDSRDRERDREKEERGSEKSEDSGRYSRQTSRQSSLKRVLMRKDSKEASSDSEQTPPVVERKYGDEAMDPVYSLLKCAADLPRQPASRQQGHACCMRSNAHNASDSTHSVGTARTSSRSSSPSSDEVSLDSSRSSSSCNCPCHTPEVLANYHASLINKNEKKGKKT